MTSLDKLYRSFDVLKISMQTHTKETRKKEIDSLLKKDKITHLNLIHEYIVAYNGKQTDDFIRSLTHSIELFLMFFDDSDKDVCFVAEDCLNKTIKCLIDSNLGRLQVSFYRVLRRNESEKCIRGALMRFAELCHLIRPHKCRNFAVYLLKEGVLRNIASREEETIQSVLSQCINKIASAFCCCMNDSEIRQLLDSFLNNLSNESSINTYRRVAATCLSTICLYSKNPLVSYFNLYEELLRLILPFDEKTNKFSILGVLLCFRQIIMHLSDLASVRKFDSDGPFCLESICEIFEICVHYLDYDDNSIVIASLECLQVLLKTRLFKFDDFINKNESFTQSLIKNRKIAQYDSQIKFTSEIQNELSVENSIEIDNTLNDALNSSIEVDFTTSTKEYSPKIDENYPLTLEKDDFFVKNENDDEVTFIENDEIDLNGDGISIKTETITQIGSLFNENESPLVYFVRLIAYKYLLNGQKNGLKNDTEVKVLVKSLAFDCITYAIFLQPNLIELSLFIDDENEQNLSDLMLYLNHTDDKIKINVYTLIGLLIKTNLIKNCSSFDYENMINVLLEQLKNEKTSNMCKKSILTTFDLFLNELLRSKNGLLALNIILNIIQLKNSNYNLVKIELVQLLSSIDYKKVIFYEKTLNETLANSFLKKPSIQEFIMNEVFLGLLKSDDNKVRYETAKHFVALCKNLCLLEFKKQIETNDSYLLMLAQSLNLTKSNTNYIFKLNDQKYELNLRLVLAGLKTGEHNVNFVEPFRGYITSSQRKGCNQLIEHNINYIVSYIVRSICEASDKYQLIGSLEFFNQLFSAFDPYFYLSSDCLIDLCNLVTSMLNNSLICYDLYLHDILLRLFGRLACALVWNNYNNSTILIDYLTKSYSPKRDWCFLFADIHLVQTNSKFFSHIMKLLCILATVIDETTLPSSQNIITGLVSEQDSPEKTNSLGAFQNSSFYLKIFEQTKVSFKSYKKSFQINSPNDRFQTFTKSVLTLFSQLLEYAISSNEISKYLDECLMYLKVIFSVDSENTVKCVTQLLKAMFNMNFACLFFNSCLQVIQQNQTGNTTSSHKVHPLSNLTTLTPFKHQTQQNQTQKNNLFYFLIKNPILQFNSFIYSQSSLFKNENSAQFNHLNSNTFIKLNENDVFLSDFKSLTQNITSVISQTANKSSTNFGPSGIFNFVKRKISVSVSNTQEAQANLTTQRLDSKLVAQFIRPFETIVIKSLHQYSITSSVNFQAKILDLLIQLLNLKINYNLLDGDKALMDFFLRQFEYFEEKRCSNGCILDKSLMEIDYCNPDDIDFCVNQVVLGSFDGKINEHHRYYTIIPKLFEFLILISYEKLTNNSRSPLVSLSKLIQIANNLLASENLPQTHVLPALKQLVNELFLYKSSQKDYELERDILVQTLLRVIEYPQTWSLLTLVVFKYKQDGNDEKWKRISRQICDSLFELIKQNKLKFNIFDEYEDNICRNESNVFNSYLESLKVLIQLFNYLCPQVFRPIDFVLVTLLDLINQQKLYENDINSWLCNIIVILNLTLNNSSEDIILARLQDLIANLQNNNQIIDDYDLLSPAIYLSKYLLKPLLVSFENINTTTYHLVINLLLYFIYMSQSGYFKKLSSSFKIILKNDDIREKINASNRLVFNQLSRDYPLISIYWQYFLLLNGSLVQNEICLNTLNGHLVQNSSLMLFCEYLSKLQDNTIELTHLLVNRITDLLLLINETPVLDLISIIHRNQSASLLYIQSIRSNWSKIIQTKNLYLLKTTLKTLEGLHLSCSSQLTWLLIEKYFSLPYLWLVRYADYIACQRLEMIISLSAKEISSQFKDKNLIDLMLNYFNNKPKILNRHQRLIDLLKQLEVKLSETSDSEIDDEIENIKESLTIDQQHIALDKEWFYNLVRSLCCNQNSRPKLCSLLLAKLDMTSLMSILVSKEFNLAILPDCILVGCTKSTENLMHDLWLASKKSLFEHLNDFNQKLPNQYCTIYESKLNELQNEINLYERMHPLVKSINTYLDTITHYKWLNNEIEFFKNSQEIIDFKCFEMNLVAHRQQLLSMEYIQDSLKALLNILLNETLVDNFKSRKNYILVLTNLMKSLYRLVVTHTLSNCDENLIFVEKLRIHDSPHGLFDTIIKLKCIASEMKLKVPFFLRKLLKKLLISIYRLPIIDRFARIPPNCLSNTSFEYFTKTEIPTMPQIDDLKDPLILKVYLDSILSIGWRTRTQFEYEYVNMLSLLNELLRDDDSEAPIEEQKERMRCFTLVIRALSTWLVNATLTPFSGNLINSKYEFISRNRALLVLEKSNYGKLKEIVYKNSRLYNETRSFSNLFEVNIERLLINDLPNDIQSYFTFNQISLDGLIKLMGGLSLSTTRVLKNQTVTNKAINSLLKVAEYFVDDLDSNLLAQPKQDDTSQIQLQSSNEASERSFIKNNLDIPSVLRSILDTYESLFINTKVSIQLKHDLIKSSVYLAQSVFDSKVQIEHLAAKIESTFEFIQELDDSNDYESDQLVDNSFISLGIYSQFFLKAYLAAHQELQAKDCEKLIKISENLLKSSSLAVKLATLNGLQYLLELINDGYLTSSEILSKQLIDLICKQVFNLKDYTVYAVTNSRFISLLWSIVIYTCENCLNLVKDAQSFLNLFLKLSCDILLDKNTPFWLFNQIFFGIERLILSNIIPSSELIILNKLSNAKLLDEQRILSLQLLRLSLIYANLDSYRNLEPESAQILELVNSFFTRMKNSETSKESFVYAKLLPQILCDFLPTHDLLNKLITEFSNSSQHLYPESIAFVLNKCFHMLIKEHNLRTQIREWCILSLSNFIQRQNVYESIWLINCLLISVSDNEWLQATFPLVLNRYGLFEDIDKTIFLMSTIEFLKQIEDRKQFESILAAFKLMAINKNIYFELVRLIDS